MAAATRPLVFAHRGASEAMPEHTLAAYLHALSEGTDGLEADVRLTRDGHLVCVHDRRVNRTSNGRGRVSAYTLAELEALDFGSWHPAVAGASGTMVREVPDTATVPGPAPDGPAPDGPGAAPEQTRLLTLHRLLAAVRAHGQATRLLIETKHPSRYGAAVEHRLIEVLDRFGLADPHADEPLHVTVMSFSALALRRVRRLAPNLDTVYLLGIPPPGVGRGRLPFGVPIGGPSVRLVRKRPHLVSALRAAGHRIFVWTVNDESSLEMVLRCGVDGIITDRPRFVLERLGR